MNNNNIITTVSLGIPQKQNYGIIATVLLCKILGIKLDIPSYLFINAISTYKDKASLLPEFLSHLNDANAVPQHVIKDTESIKYTPSILANLSNNGYILEKKVKKIKCDCGRIDAKEDAETRYNFIKNGKCVFCGGEVKNQESNELVFQMPKNIILSYQMIPNRHSKNLQNLQNALSGREILISKSRNTGLRYGEYNIDIDFNNYLLMNSVPCDNHIILASANILQHMAMFNGISRVLYGNEKHNIFIMVPYLTGEPHIEKIKNVNNLQLFLLNSINKFDKVDFDNGFITMLNKPSKHTYVNQLIDWYYKPESISIDQLEGFYLRIFLNNNKQQFL